MHLSSFQWGNTTMPKMMTANTFECSSSDLSCLIYGMFVHFCFMRTSALLSNHGRPYWTLNTYSFFSIFSSVALCHIHVSCAYMNINTSRWRDSAHLYCYQFGACSIDGCNVTINTEILNLIKWGQAYANRVLMLRKAKMSCLDFIFGIKKL